MTASGCRQLLGASIILHELGNCLKNHHGASGENNDEDGDQKDAQDQGTDVQALGGGGIALGPSDIAHRLPVPRLGEKRR